MKILITGSNGLLGQKLVHLLARQEDIHLIATARGRSVIPISKGEYHTMDITNRGETEEILIRLKPDVIIHTAAMTQVDQCEAQRDDCWRVNVTAVENLVKISNKINAHLIHVSTDFIFDGSHGPLDESAIPAPVNFYGESKLAAEQAVIMEANNWCIIRTVLVYGITADMSRSNIVVWVKNSLTEGKSIQVVNDQWRTPTLAEDLAMGCYLAAKKKARGIYHISGKDFLSPYDMAIKTADFFQLDKSLIRPTDASKFTQPAKRPQKTGFIITKAQQELGYEPHSFDEGLAIVSQQIAAHS